MISKLNIKVSMLWEMLLWEKVGYRLWTPDLVSKPCF